MKYFDRIKETSTTTGTGNLTLAGAVSQFEAFSTRFAVGEPIPYTIAGQSGTQWETGVGTLSDATTFVRTVVLYSSNGDAAVNLSAGTKDVFCSIIADEATRLTAMGDAYAMSRGMDLN